MIVAPAIEAYVEAHTTPPEPHLNRLAAETQASLECPQMLTGPVEGRLLETLVFLQRPKLVLEIGTYSGYSALSMVRALPPGGRILTCELSDERADFAERHIAEAKEEGRIEVLRGPALDTIAGLDGPFDLVFIDADKAGYPGYYEAVLPKLGDDGLIVVDNVLYGGDVVDPQGEGARAIAQFNDRVVDDERVVCVVLSVRDGVSLIRRRTAWARPAG